MSPPDSVGSQSGCYGESLPPETEMLPPIEELLPDAAAATR